jgi:hypothetical protein
MTRRFLLSLVLCSAATRTAAAQVEVLSPTVVEQSARPGTAVNSVIVLHNPDTTTQYVRIYQEDYRFYADGRSLFDPPGTEIRSNARWIGLSSSQLAIEPGKTAKIVVVVNVPADSLLLGSYWSIVLVEPAPNEADGSATDATPNAAVGVHTRIRHAIQIVTHIGESGRHDLRFADHHVDVSPDGHRGFRFDVLNCGERAYRPQLVLEIYDADGRLLLTRSQARGLIYPGTSIAQSFDIDTLQKGDYTALILADTKGAEVFGARLKLRL